MSVKQKEKRINKQQILKRINWNYNITNEDIETVMNCEQEYAGHRDYNNLLVRMFETLSWYELLEVFGKGELGNKLVPEILSKLRNSDMQEKYLDTYRYERIGKILQGESVLFAR